MKFSFSDEKLMYVETMFRRIADQYLKMLNGQLLYRAKLDVLEVFVDDNRGFDDFQGRFTMKDEKNACSIIIHATPDLCEAEVAMVIAHELGHMLISNMGIGSLIRGKEGLDVRYGVVRFEGDDQIIGIGLEEGIAEYMAMEIVARVSEEWARKFRRTKRDKTMMFLAEAAGALSKCFGKGLNRLDQFDQTTNIGKKVSLKDDSIKPAEVVPAFRYFENVFWMSLSRQSFDLIGTLYDEVMGEGAFRTLCERLDSEFMQHPCALTTAEEKLIAALDEDRSEEALSVLAEIKQFRKMKAQKDKEDIGCSDRMIAANSLKKAFEMMKSRCRVMYIPAGNEAFEAAVNDFSKTLNRGRVWSSIPAARAAFDRLNGMDKPILSILYVDAIGQILDAACKVAAYYAETRDAAKTPDEDVKSA